MKWRTRGCWLVVLAGFWVLLPGVTARGAAPEVPVGECLYLVGAPPGAPAATDEERNGDGGLFDICENPVAGGAANRDGENMVQAWIEKWIDSHPDSAATSCRAFAWVSHDFRVPDAAAGEVRGIIAMEGVYQGIIDSGTVGTFCGDTPIFDSGALLRVQLLELSDETGGRDVATESVVFSYAFPEGILKPEGPFGRRLEATLRPAHTYRVRLYLEVWVEDEGAWDPCGFNRNWEEVNFGLPGWYGKGKVARYDSIEVCLGEPDSGPEILSRLDVLETKVDGAVADIGQLGTDLATVGGEVAENGQKLDEALSDLAQLQSDMALLRDDIAANGQKLDQVLLLLAGLQAKECEQIRLLLTPEGRRASDCCGAPLDFPNGKDAPSCGGGAP